MYYSIKSFLEIFRNMISFNKASMQFIGFRRILISLIFIPLFLIVLLNHNIFMLLDYVLFPFFLKTKIKKPVFIISNPRSGTTFLLRKIFSFQEKYTAIHLWEIIFAPSITQKYIILAIISVIGFFGRIFKKISSWFGQTFLKRFLSVHEMEINEPEEDDAILLWNLNTAFLHYLFPGSKHFEKYFFFDEQVPDKQKKYIMKVYHRMIQRHNYVFNRSGKKSFLSKNPLMMSKFDSVMALYPDAKVLIPTRCPKKVIPSTFELARALYLMLTGKTANEKLKNRTTDLLVYWYENSFKFAEKHPDNSRIINFNRLAKNDDAFFVNLCQFLEIDKDLFKAHFKIKTNSGKRKNPNYTALSEEQLETILKESPLLKEYCEK